MKKFDISKVINFAIMLLCSILFAVIVEFLVFNNKMIFNGSTVKDNTYLNFTVLENEDSTVHLVSNNIQGYVDKICVTFGETMPDAYDIIINTEGFYGNSSKKVINAKPFSREKTDLVNVKSYVNSIELRFSNSIEIGAITVKNRIVFNIYRFIFFFFSSFLILLLFFYRKVIAGKLEYGFLMVILIVGILFCIIMPANTSNSWDEHIHFSKSYSLSFLDSNVKWTEAASLFARGKANFRENTYEERRKADKTIDGLNGLVDYDEQYQSPLMFAKVGYISQAFFLWIGRILKLPFHLVFILGRLGNLLIYAVCCFYAIRYAKKGKAIILVIALLPTSVFLATTYGYDPTSIGFSLLGCSVIVSELLDPGQKLSLKKAAVFTFSIILASLPKIVYCPLILLAFLLPRTKFRHRKQEKMFKLGIFIIFILILIAFILPSLFGKPLSGDPRGGDTSVVRQVRLIVANPISYARILISNILSRLSDLLFGKSIISLYGYRGSLNNNLYYLILALLLFAVFTDTKSEATNKSILLTQKIFILFIIITITALIWTSLYVRFTPVGSSVINGVQSRYFIPVLYLIALLFNTSKIKNEISNKVYYLTILCVPAAVLLVSIYQIMLKPLCF